MALGAGPPGTIETICKDKQLRLGSCSRPHRQVPMNAKISVQVT
ncbi:hypothetical protein RMSM_06368 [Rhodopirellula maiorica SM1]|uniref:Uncharacterized protein n=1 Tax=Rhodopirellula maiorica SM1 TaxID=1265738 RepID=M5RMV1_9BACT|nr:hypothetical protein RMSM_06368 [Rhodopirellula maiorica SM1]